MNAISLAKEIPLLLTDYPVDAAYLFGSQANGYANEKSDVDIAVLVSSGLSKEERFNLRIHLIGLFSKVFHKDADVVVLNDISSLFFQYMILREGQLVYEKSESARLDFSTKTLGRYFDFQPFLDVYNHHYVQRSL